MPGGFTAGGGNSPPPVPPDPTRGQGEIDWGGVAVLIAATVALVVVAAEYFERKAVE